MSEYTVGEIGVWLVLTAILGFVLGWLFRELRYRGKHGAAGAPAQTGRSEASPSTDPSPYARPVVIESAGFANSAKALAGGKAPSTEHVIKGSKDSMTYHVPGDPAYGLTIAELWFTSEADAMAAGFRKPGFSDVPAKKAVAKKAVSKKARAMTPGRFPGSAKPLSGGRAPSNAHRVKGNEATMVYRTPESPSYAQMIAETWFRTEAAAVAAGFRKPENI